MLFTTQDRRWPAGESACEDLSFQGGVSGRASVINEVQGGYYI